MVKVVINNNKGLVQYGGQSGATRIEEGIDISRGNASVDAKLKMITASVFVANGATSGKSTAKVIPAGFTAISAHVEVTGASTNAVTIDRLGTEADPNGFTLTGMGLAANAVGSAGSFACGGALSIGSSNSAGAAALDELNVTMADPGLAGCTVKVSLLGYVFSA